MTHSGRWSRHEVRVSIDNVLDAAKSTSPQVIIDEDGGQYTVTYEAATKRPSATSVLLRGRVETKN